LKTRVILLCCALLSCGREAAKDPSLVGWWKFDEGKGKKARDFSGNGLNGKLNDCGWTDGKSGKALRFEGGSFVVVKHRPVLDSPGAELTVAAWVRRDSSRAWNTVASRQTGSGWSEYIGLAVFADTALFSVDPDGSHYSNIKDTAECPAGTWVHLAGTVRDSAFTLYVNGIPVNRGRFHPPILYADANPLIIGGNTNSQGEEWIDTFHGIIDDVRLYRRALDASEILAIVSE